MGVSVVKRNGGVVVFDVGKIQLAIERAMSEVGFVNSDIAKIISETIRTEIENSNNGNSIHVDDIHNMVENKLMDFNLNTVAKTYILYRANSKANIFKKRTNLKPYEYPHLYDYVDAIRHSYWLHSEFNYTSDIQDVMSNLTDSERSVVIRAMLAISQVEVAVKSFWGDIYKKMPKPEIGAVGSTFAESEVRHADAYSELINILGLNDEFEKIQSVPAIKGRIKYLENVLAKSAHVDNQNYFESIILFSMFVENVSLFSQFLIIMSFNKFKNYLKGISNAVEATSKEEQIHAQFGFDLVNIIKQENPRWWTSETINDIIDATVDSFEAECGVIDWIFEHGDLEFLTKKQVVEYVRYKYNQSLKSIGIDPIFTVDETLLSSVDWFEDEVLVSKHTDFFNKRSINYTKRQKSVTSDDLF